MRQVHELAAVHPEEAANGEPLGERIQALVEQEFASVVQEERVLCRRPDARDRGGVEEPGRPAGSCLQPERLGALFLAIESFEQRSDPRRVELGVSSSGLLDRSPQLLGSTGLSR